MPQSDHEENRSTSEERKHTSLFTESPGYICFVISTGIHIA